jgi:predicted dehydrogenase
MGRTGKRAPGGDRPKDAPPVPEGLDWDLWLGPAPFRPYHNCYCPGAWRGWWDFGNGTLGDYGCHYMDLPFWALGLRYPTTVEGEGSPVNPETTPRSLMVRWEFPARGDRPPVKLTWCHGIDLPKVFEHPELSKDEYGIVFVGDKGMLAAHYGWHRLIPAADFAGFKAPEPTIPNSIGHYEEWIQACKTGSATTCNFDYSGALTEAVLLGNVAYRLGKKLDWDPVNLKAVNCPEADQYLRRE